MILYIGLTLNINIMKTEKEIAEWLKQQSWYNEFVENIKIHCKHNGINTNLKLSSILSGKCNMNTIIAAFHWGNYPHNNIDGGEYWRNINLDFINWYNSKENKTENKTKNQMKKIFINNVEIKPGMLIYINGYKAENVHIVFPMKDGLGAVSYNESKSWDRLEDFIKYNSDNITKIEDLPEGGNLKGDILWQKPKIKINKLAIAEKFNLDIEEFEIV